jgi:ubiquinone/menaquinone biosynthesis C-methylase UbiE
MSISAVHNFDDVEQGLREIARVAKKRVAITVLKASKKFEDIDALMQKIFTVHKIILESKDVIYFAEKK